MTYAADPNPNLIERIRRWKSAIPWLNTRVPAQFIAPVCTLCLGAKYKNGWGGHAGFGESDTDSLFYNGAFFIRLVSLGYRGVPVQLLAAVYLSVLFSWWWMVLAGLWCVQVRWSADGVTIFGKRVAYLQSYWGGSKLNGEWVVVPRLRFQNDDTAAAGTTGANPDQARGWNAGTK